MDAFFASVEERNHPEYKGKPIIVGSDPKDGAGRGVVAACSYEARKFGIHSALPISIAYRKCPKGIFLRPDMEAYSEASHQIIDIFERFTPEIEPISIDEAFLDITGSWQLFGTPLDICKKIKNTIKKETGLTASIGMAPNKMTAKIASDIEKPDGLVVVDEEHLLSFLHPLPVEKLWGVGEKTLQELLNIGIKTIGDLSRANEEKLYALFGENGYHMWELANGIDPRDVEVEGTVKSISNEYTFESDTNDIESIKDALMYLSEKVSRRSRKSDIKGRTVTLKIRFSDFKTYTRSITLGSSTNFSDILFERSWEKAESFDLTKRSVRLVGVKLSNLSDSSWCDDLFDGETLPPNKTERIHKALDKIKDRFGDDLVGRRNV